MDKYSDFENLYVDYFPRLVRFVREYVISGEDAENIVQDVFEEIWKRKEVFSDNINLVAFLFTSVKNRSLNFLSRELTMKKVENAIQEEYFLSLQLKHDSLEVLDVKFADDESLEQLLHKTIDSLPERCREIFIKCKLEGRKQKDVALEMGISQNTIETQMGIAYKKIREELKDYFPLLLFLMHIWKH